MSCGYEPEGREFESLRARHSSVLACRKIKSNDGFQYRVFTLGEIRVLSPYFFRLF